MADEDKSRKKPPLPPPPKGRERKRAPWLTDGQYTLRWIAAWVVFLAVVGLLTRTRAGYAVVYHLIVLAIVVLVLGQYRRFAAIEEPISGISVQ